MFYIYGFTCITIIIYKLECKHICIIIYLCSMTFFSHNTTVLNDILSVLILSSSSFPPTYLFLTKILVSGMHFSGLLCPHNPSFFRNKVWPLSSQQMKSLWTNQNRGFSNFPNSEHFDILSNVLEVVCGPFSRQLNQLDLE